MSQNDNRTFDEMMKDLEGNIETPASQVAENSTNKTQMVTPLFDPTDQTTPRWVPVEFSEALASLPITPEEIHKELNNNMLKLVQSAEVRNIAMQVNLEDAINTVPVIGGSVINELDQISTSMIANIEKVPLENGDKLIKNLERIMDKVDIQQVFKDAKEIQKPGIMYIISNKLVKSGMSQIMSKYNTLSSAFENIESEYARIINELSDSTQTLLAQLKTSKSFYENLDAYIAVLYVLKERIALDIIPELRRKFINSGHRMIEQEINQYFMALQLVDQRLIDLQINQQTILQTVPMIQNSIMTNHQLGMGFRTALDSVPLLKSNIVTALEMKRGIIAGHTLEKAQEMRNKQLANMGQASLKQAELATKALGGSSVTIETLQKVSQDVTNAQKQLTAGIKDSFMARDVARHKIIDMKSKMIADSRQSSQELLDIASLQKLEIK